MFCTKSLSCTMKRVIQNSCVYFSAIEKLPITSVSFIAIEATNGKRQDEIFFFPRQGETWFISAPFFSVTLIYRETSQKEWDRLKNVNFHGFLTRSCLHCLPIAVNVMLNLSYITRTGTQTWMCPLYSWIIFLIKLQRWVRTRHNTWFMQIGDLFLKDFSRTNIFCQGLVFHTAWHTGM